MSRFAQFAVAAAQLAADDAGLVLDDAERRRAASAIATGAGGAIDTMERGHPARNRGANRVSPFYVPTMAPTWAPARSDASRSAGPAMASVAACASGLYSSSKPSTHRQRPRRRGARGRHRGSASPAADRRPREHEGALSRATTNQARQPARSTATATALSSAKARRHGDRIAGARIARGAPCLRRAAGGGLSCDAYHITAPREDGIGAAEAMTEAMQASRTTARGIDYIAAHGTGTPLNDAPRRSRSS